MLRALMVSVAILVFLNGCAAYRNDSLERMQALPQHYVQFDAKFAWQVKSAGSSSVIEGVIQNIRYYEMNDLEIWVFLLDARGKEVFRTVDFVYSLKENEAAQFMLKIPHVASGAKLRFLYRYLGHEGGGESGSATRWSQSFKSEVP